MRLLIDGDVFRWQRAGGISRVYAEVIPRMAALDPKLDLRVVLRGGPVSGRLGSIGASTVRIPQLPPGLKPWRLWRHVTPGLNARLAGAFWRRQKGDVFHSTYYTLPPVSCPSVCLVLDMIPELFPGLFGREFLDEMLERKRMAAQKAKLVICISLNTQRDLVRILGVPETKCRVVPLAGVSATPVEAAAEPRAKRPFLLYVGDYLSPYKNFLFLLRCLQSDRGDFADLPLDVVSRRRPTAGELETYRELLPAGRLRFDEECDDAALAGLYGSCSAFVYPSLYEGFGLPVLEALACGAPVVCADTPALRETGGDVVYFFDPESPSDFLRALGSALRDGRADEKVRERKAHARVFSWDKTAEGFLNTFREASGAGESV
ncbi:glycosyltransferase family 4 protein [Verrucomicrobiota bacterium]